MGLQNDWADKLKKELSLPYMKELVSFLQKEKKEYEVYPPKELVLSAFHHTSFAEVKAVIIGQDPYHGPGQAEGLSFSVPKGVKIPPSLRNIFQELQDDLGLPIPETGSLLPWTKQGVFLLNATLTVRKGEPKSHYGRGWERFTDAVVDMLLEREDPVVFLLWGQAAQEKGRKILGSSVHKVFMAAHPSPYSAANFKGCSHFSKTNQCLREFGKEPINWSL